MARKKLPRLTFTITPNANGYLIACTEIPSIFTDVVSVSKIDKSIQDLIYDYVDSFPEDARKRGIKKSIPAQAVWIGRPNSVALD